ncbi:RNA degradosome polyphosphate kinase [[Clostridium] fimetarium]|uniref:Polyphosphate kinase n=1 Tax=[Clostridium] fimetarium TaxID=99656 RepID=A0A1I0MQ59_9FIRM|nr:RNA degradosome polyphosphate kinase [[Clostridium] fimetarium]SEV90160.1 polyphosphate kinase [[Clostridium] fimetarium]
MEMPISENYFNRELSWMQFNNRVLSEARDKNIPLFERLKFLSITASNLDEFVMIRVASLKDMVSAGYEKKDIAGMTPSIQLDKINELEHELVSLQYSTLNHILIPHLAQNDINIVSDFNKLNDKQKEFVDKYFENEVYPVLTPMAFDSSRPFPLIRNKTLNIASLLQRKNGDKELDFATVQVPSVLPRIIQIPSEKGTTVILLEQIIEKNIQKLYLNYNVITSYPYRIMRNADFEIDEEDVADLLQEIQKQIKKRQWGEAIKLEVEEKIDKRLLKMLKKNLKIEDKDIYYINGPLDLTFLMKVYSIDGFDQLKSPKYMPQSVCGLNCDEDIFTQIKEGDILLHHPYESFEPVVDFIRKAANDPQVLAIKQTLYRVSGHSLIIASLAEAAERGKQVTVLVELKARFDEENNIIWAKKLEKAGCHVIYGLMGLKTHCKITLVVRREEDGIKRYVHLGTGNYNDSTAKLYTDLGLLTCANQIGEDATAVFNMISGYSEPLKWNKLSLAPIWLRDKFLYLIDREIKIATEGKSAHIIIKMNSLSDKRLIDELYKASCAGVKIDLIVRGICCLIPGVIGLSENITVRSIIGNFLEHARMFYFENGGYDDIYLGSADWMPRNLDKRVEIIFPVEDQNLKKEVLHILEIQLSDNEKSHILQTDGSYEKVDRRGRKEVINAQEIFCAEAIARNNSDDKRKGTRRFIPRENAKIKEQNF